MYEYEERLLKNKPILGLQLHLRTIVQWIHYRHKCFTNEMDITTKHELNTTAPSTIPQSFPLEKARQIRVLFGHMVEIKRLSVHVFALRNRFGSLLIKRSV